MPDKINKHILIDSGLWIGYCDSKDQYHKRSLSIFSEIQRFHIYFPWPIYYEVLRTRFVKDNRIMARFDNLLKTLQPHFIDDNEYRDKALERTIESSKNSKRAISLVDMVIRLILSDNSYKISNFFTFNDKDFLDVCKKRAIPLNLSAR